ncbi:hypothetical protein LUZ63_005692 [Rhynchospora breviuscula]|uniref:Methyltransferase type 12 domain-containing protein n=1 Tax=Rhynchospora breviuscula TaxID=2022672 RepID=A0A9Q0CNG9_9POAL|nr:hypothetical protein LUZ63_005692 [Rhynchospora breviuscula]
MALLNSVSPTRSVAVPALLLLSAASGALLLFCLLPSLSPSTSTSCSCNCPATSTTTTTVTTTTTSPSPKSIPTSTSQEDILWLKKLLAQNLLVDVPLSQAEWHELRKGINPRTRAQQLQDLLNFHGIAHYEGLEADNHTALPCPGELLVEEHHSNYGEPWAGGRDVFEFLASATNLSPSDMVMEIGCGTLRVGIHFIQYLDPNHFHCLERDKLSLMAALRYELPSHGLLYKRPLIIKGEDMDFTNFGEGVSYDLIYASAVFLHIPDKLVWVGLERLASRLKSGKGRIFVSHNIKFCRRLGGEECKRRLTNLGLEYVGVQTHDSLLFNHYETWFEFRRLEV